MPIKLAENSQNLTAGGHFIFCDAGDYMQVIFMPSTDFAEAAAETRLAMLYGMKTVIDQMTAILTEPTPPVSQMS